MQWMILPYKRYFDFSGRSRRMEYWMFFLFTMVVAIACFLPFYGALISIGLSSAGNDPKVVNAAVTKAFSPGVVGGLVLGGFFMLGTFIPAVAVAVRRLHDRDMSGWWYLGYFVASMIPLLNIIAFIAGLVVMCLEGTRGPNRFGNDPKDPTSAAVFE